MINCHFNLECKYGKNLIHFHSHLVLMKVCEQKLPSDLSPPSIYHHKLQIFTSSLAHGSHMTFLTEYKNCHKIVTFSGTGIFKFLVVAF